MGADLYIQSITKKAQNDNNKLFEEAVAKRDQATTDKEKLELQEDVDKYYDAMYPEGYYFRDPYNNGSVLWQMNLSWWGDVGKLLTKNGYISIANIKKFKQMIVNRPISLTHQIKNPEGLHEPENPEWVTYFIKQREELLRFLDNAIELNEKIRCSI
jgi:hypothetical protein